MSSRIVITQCAFVRSYFDTFEYLRRWRRPSPEMLYITLDGFEAQTSMKVENFPRGLKAFTRYEVRPF